MKLKLDTKNTKIFTKTTTLCSLWFVVIFVSFLPGKIFSQQTEKLYLSGTGNNNTVKWEFFCTAGMNSGKWTTIPVPSCWELQGFGKYDYGFAKDDVRGKEKGLYKYSFNISAAWRNKTIKIVFEGVMTDAEVKVNGQAAGEIHQGAFYSFDYDITKLLRFGETNLLEVTVAKHSANESVNGAERRADFWIFGGIFRPVYLEALPSHHIQRVAIDAKANGQFTAAVFCNKTNVGILTAQLYSMDGIKTGSLIAKKISSGDSIFVLQTILQHPKLWNPEFPNLYMVEINLVEKGKIVHTIKRRFGFRTIEIKERDGIYVNGVKVKMKGVCRHSFWPTSGRTTSKKLSIESVSLMKDMNMNAVRMSHYPPDDHFLDACDSIGLFVIDELAGWHGHYDTPTGTKLLKKMIAHDVNHPSVIFWANGNEGGHNLDLDPLFSDYDLQRRPVLHPWQLFGGVETQHYREYNYGIGNYEHGHDIIMPTEFLHGLYDGGHGAGLEDYWEAMWKNPLSAGGFLWDFADEGVIRKDKNDSIDTDGNHGADGILGPFHEKEGSYFTIKEIWSPVHIEATQVTDKFDGKLTIENRYHFTNINQCSFTWSLVELNYGKSDISFTNGTALSPDIKPGCKGTLQINLPASWKKFDVLYVTSRDAYHHEIVSWSFPIHSPAHVIKKLWPLGKSTKVQLAEQDNNYVITASGLTISIDKNSGILKQVRQNSNTIPFNNGPVLQEGVNNFKNFVYHYEGDTLVVESSFDRKNNFNTLKWTIYPTGLLKMEVRYFPGAYFTDFTGVNFSFPEKEIREVLFMGNGPYRVWKNRMKGTRFGVWDKKYNNTETGEAPWIYPEFKGYYSNMYWCRFFAGTQSFRIMTEDEDIFLRLFTPAFKDDQWHNYQLLFPGGDISFMQAIPGIGTKTQRAETTGPMGMKNIFYDYEKDPSRALKMVLYFDFSVNDE